MSKLRVGVEVRCTASSFMTRTSRRTLSEPRTTGTGRLLSETRRRLHELGLHARKRLGQHYLVDEEALELIVSSAGLSGMDLVIEVGPGLGVLTRELVRRAGWVAAIELDDNLAAALEGSLSSFNNLVVINQDILKVDPAAVLDEIRERLPPSVDSSSYKVVANLPYYITAPVIRHFLEARIRPRMMVFTVQKEVAEAITARPGEMSILAVSIQFYGRPRIVGYIPAGSFYPAPEVDSAVVRIDTYPEPALAVSDVNKFFELVRAGFAAARKQVANSLAHRLGLPKDTVVARLQKAGIDPQRRAETLTIEEWGKIWHQFT